MARTARKIQDTSIYSIEQQSKVQLFRNDADRQKMIDIVSNAQKKFGFTCYAFCLLSDYGFKFILDVKDKNISNIVSSISIAYALYRKADTKLFTQRFKSIPLYSKEEVSKIVQLINRPSDSRYNSYCFYHQNNSDPLDWLVDVHHQPIEIIREKKSAEIEDADHLLKQWLMKNDCCMDDLKKNKPLRNECIVRLHRETNCSMKQLGSLFGGLSESLVSKIIKNTEQTG